MGFLLYLYKNHVFFCISFRNFISKINLIIGPCPDFIISPLRKRLMEISSTPIIPNSRQKRDRIDNVVLKL